MTERTTTGHGAAQDAREPTTTTVETYRAHAASQVAEKQLQERDEQLGQLAARIAKLEPVAEAGRDLINSLTGAVAYSSGKWTAHGKDRTLHVLTDAVARLYPDVPIGDAGPSSGYDLRHMQDAVRAKLGKG